MMTEACGATNCTMMEVGGVITSMMKVCGAIKLLHRMKEVCGATSRIMKDKLIVGEHQVDVTQLLIYIYIYLS